MQPCGSSVKKTCYLNTPDSTQTKLPGKGEVLQTLTKRDLSSDLLGTEVASTRDRQPRNKDVFHSRMSSKVAVTNANFGLSV